MTKNSKKTNKRDPQRADLVKKTADIHHVTPRYVYQILAMERESEEILATYMFLLQEGNRLVEEAAKLVPFK
jgi:hypothetical protein